MSILRISSLAQSLGLQLEAAPPKKKKPSKPPLAIFRRLDSKYQGKFQKSGLWKHGKAMVGNNSLSDRQDMPDKPVPAKDKPEGGNNNSGHGVNNTGNG